MICAAPRLKKVILLSASNVTTPSLMDWISASDHDFARDSSSRVRRIVVRLSSRAFPSAINSVGRPRKGNTAFECSCCRTISRAPQASRWSGAVSQRAYSVPTSAPRMAIIAALAARASSARSLAAARLSTETDFSSSVVMIQYTDPPTTRPVIKMIITIMTIRCVKKLRWGVCRASQSISLRLVGDSH